MRDKHRCGSGALAAMCATPKPFGPRAGLLPFVGAPTVMQSVGCAMRTNRTNNNHFPRGAGLPAMSHLSGLKPLLQVRCCRRPAPGLSRIGSEVLYLKQGALHDAVKERGNSSAGCPVLAGHAFYGFLSASSVASSSSIGFLPSNGLSHSARFLARNSLRKPVTIGSFTSSKVCCLASRFSSNLMMW